MMLLDTLLMVPFMIGIETSNCDSRHKLAERAVIAVFGIFPKRNFPLKVVS